MNVETNFLADTRLRDAKTPVDQPSGLAIVTDLDTALRIPDHETFWLAATPVRRLVSCGRVGVEFSLPDSANDAREERLMAWVNAQSHDTDTVLAATATVGREPIPMRRSRAGFHISFDALNGAA